MNDLGLDISTTTVGIAILGRDGTLRHLGHVSPKGDTIFEKADCVRHHFEELALDLKIHRIFVEQNMMNFAAGKTSAQTMFSLAKFNGIISYVSRQVFVPRQVLDVNVSSARKAIGCKIDRKDKSKSTKDKVFDFVKNAHPELPWITHVAKTGKSKGQVVFDKENGDRCDAWVICRGGQLLHSVR